MALKLLTRRVAPIVTATALALVLAACSSSGGIVTKRTQGYEISESALKQVRPGQSQELVTLVLGSPQSTNTFGDESAFYYVQTKIDETAFGLKMIKSRTVLAVYFDKNKKVSDKAVYTLEDGKVIAIESRRTASFGEDRSFVDQILQSF
ncbi:outer membrane protein assembly factor BamE [Devosia rhodophyticola]|uniref:Outer membrane protein assembly factor BamE n=1 Tax=Devosia rhodophyticola TaxID=3026423 RepID=A0ABY7YXH1_9HYPH|nr:outer membrane protein assembly factor BamE [Devosia rhodophyticola]WDR06083.1 outer membrane protein assembly factor BamE [Devosia rhodophyticola]